MRDPQWPAKVLIIGLILLIPILGAINGLGWMLATLDGLRAGEEKLAPGSFRYLGRGIRLFAVELVYALGIVVIGAVIYAPAVLVLAQEGRGPVNPVLVSVGVLLSSLALSVVTLGTVALNFALPAIVLATDRGGMAAGLGAPDVARSMKRSIVNTLIAGLMLIAAGFIGSLGLIVCGVGAVFTTAYSLAMQAWIVRSYEIGVHAPQGA